MRLENLAFGKPWEISWQIVAHFGSREDLREIRISHFVVAHVLPFYCFQVSSVMVIATSLLIVNVTSRLLIGWHALVQRLRVLLAPHRAVLLTLRCPAVTIKVRCLVVHLRYLVNYPEEVNVG